VSRRNNSHRAPILCYVTDRRGLGGAKTAEACEKLLQKIAAAAAAGVDWIQIREKDLSGKECAALAGKALEGVASSSAGGSVSTRILVNDRLDVALAERAGGVHLGENSLPLGEVKGLLKVGFEKSEFLIGVSCHSLEGARAAASAGADYLFFGPVFHTPSKAVYGEPQGLGRLAEVCRAVSVPVLAIGSITLENAGSCFSAGASGIAAIRLFQDAQDIPAVARALRKAAT